MATPNRTTRAPSSRPRKHAWDSAPARERSVGWQGEGFGLVLDSPYPITGIARRVGRVPGDAIRLSVDTGPAPLPAGERLRELRHSDGRLGFAIDDLGGLGLRIAAPGVGGHHVSRDGRVVRSWPDTPLELRWQQLLLGQVIPLVAALRGLEVLHASAVVRGGLAFAFAGDSGVGKSTLAARLALRGNDLLADDVLTVSLGDSGEPQGHRGSTALSVLQGDGQLASQLLRGGAATVLESDGKRRVLLSTADRVVPLGAVYRLRHDRGGGEPIGVPLRGSVTDLIGASFIKYVRTPARLSAQLDVLAAIARRCPVVPVNMASGLTSAQLAAGLEAHMTAIVERGRH